MEDVFAVITMPCLLYVGADDPRCALVKAAAKSVPGSDFAVLAGCDHVQTNMRSDLVLPHVNKFLKAASQREAA
jgi:pimeloyl-ACP methyl ester carboxylesterase